MKYLALTVFAGMTFLSCTKADPYCHCTADSGMIYDYHELEGEKAADKIEDCSTIDYYADTMTCVPVYPN